MYLSYHFHGILESCCLNPTRSQVWVERWVVRLWYMDALGDNSTTLFFFSNFYFITRVFNERICFVHISAKWQDFVDLFLPHFCLAQIQLWYLHHLGKNLSSFGWICITFEHHFWIKMTLIQPNDDLRSCFNRFFLDMTIYKNEDDTLASILFRKPTAGNTVLNASSAHPSSLIIN